MGDRANIHDPVRRAYNWVLSTELNVKETIEDPIKIDKIQFTIDDFDKLCHGKYNAGALTLDSKGRLDIVNIHCDWLVLQNGKSISTDDSFAVRRAFANALQKAGLSEESMAGIRSRLGLRLDNNTCKGGLCFTPLTRQEVREIIDSHINELNANRGLDNKLQTQSQQRASKNYSKEEIKYLNAIRKHVNNDVYKNVKIAFDTDLLHTLDLLTKNDYKEFSNDKLHEMAIFFEDLEDCIAELTHSDKEDEEIWRHENPDEIRFIPVSSTLSVGVDPKTKELLLKAQRLDEKKMITFSTGLMPTRALKLIRLSNERLHLEGNKRGLMLSGSENVDLSNLSIKEIPKIRTHIIDEPLGGIEIIETKDNAVKSNRKNKINIIEEREDKPVEKPKKKSFFDTLIPVPDDDYDDEENDDPDDNELIIFTGKK